MKTEVLSEEHQQLLLQAQERARTDLLYFLQYVWWMPRPLRIGRHTRAICERLTRAVEDFLQGKSSYLIINTPYRHGKSDLVSRALPAYFLGRCASQQPDLIMSGYGTSLVKGFSKKTQAIMRSDAYQQLFPGVLPSKTFHAAEEWQVEGSQGTIVAQGLGGSITGKGGNLIVLDDYCKNREEAESKTVRDHVWESFSDDLMTRTNAPAALVVVICTRWHVDDVIGRIYESMRNDPEYPQFESMIFPARKPGSYEALFPELYPESWYRRQRAQLGSYSAAALLDCSPIGDEMKVFKDDWLAYYDNPPPRSQMNVYMLVDSANSKKENADYTTIWVIGYNTDENYYILDGVHDRMSLTERTDALFELQKKWRPLNTFWEQQGAMSDVQHVQYVQDHTGWHFGITSLNHSIPKETHIRKLQPLFEAHRIWLPKTLPKLCTDKNVRDVIREFVDDEYSTFPGVKHDDMLDPLADIQDDVVVAMTSFPQGEEELEASGGDLYRCNTRWIH